MGTFLLLHGIFFICCYLAVYLYKH